MVEIPYEGPRFSPPNYKAKCHGLEAKVAQLKAEVAALTEAGKGVVDSARQWSSPNYPTFDRIESEHIDTLAALIQGGRESDGNRNDG